MGIFCQPEKLSNTGFFTKMSKKTAKKSQKTEEKQVQPNIIVAETKTVFGFFSKIFVTMLLLLLLFSFSFWGIGDLFRGNKSKTVAKVGHDLITEQDLAETIAIEIKNIEMQTGKKINVERLRAEGVEQAALEILVERRIMENETKRLGLLLPDNIVVDMIKSDPMFLDKKGKFSKDAFNYFLNSIGETETNFVIRTKRGKITTMLVNALTSHAVANTKQAEMLSGYEGESRTANLMILPLDAVSERDVPEPTSEALQSFYETIKASFIIPEYRDVSYILINHDNVKGDIKITDEDIKKEYEAQGSSSPFESMKEGLRAQLRNEMAGNLLYELTGKLQDELASGTTFEETAKKFGLDIKKVQNLGRNGKNISGEVPEGLPKFGDFVARSFSLEEGADSALVSAQDGSAYYVLVVNKILPERVPDIEDVRPNVLSAWKQEKRLEKLREKAENAAKSLKDKNLGGAGEGWVSSSTGSVFRKTKKPENFPNEIVEELFSLKVGGYSSAYRRQDGAYVIARLESINPSSKTGEHSPEKIKAEMEQEILDDILAEYSLYLRDKYSVEYMR